MTHESLLSQLRDLKAPSREMDEAIWTATTPGASVKRWSYVHTATGKVCEVDEPRIDGGRITEVPRFTASVDAAIALAAKVLPGWIVQFQTMPKCMRAGLPAPVAGASVFPDDVSMQQLEEALGDGDAVEVHSSLAIALCLAVLSALSAINRRAE